MARALGTKTMLDGASYVGGWNCASSGSRWENQPCVCTCRRNTRRRNQLLFRSTLLQASEQSLTLAKRRSRSKASWSRSRRLSGRLRFSGAMFVECFPTQRQEAFLLGQRHAFEFWGGVARMAVYDNLKPAVLQVLEGHSRREHEMFLHFHSVYRGSRALCQCACRVGERQRRKSGWLCTP